MSRWQAANYRRDKTIKNHDVSVPGRKTVVLSVNQDAGIGPGRNKGAAVHLNAMRAAFSGLGADCRAMDEADDARLENSLRAALEEGPVDLIYERYALGKSTAARFAKQHSIPLVMEVNSPLADEQKRWRGGSNDDEDAHNDAVAMAEACEVIAVSSDVASYARLRGARPERVRVFPNGIDVDRFSPSLRNQSVRESIVPAGRFVIGFHGRERPWHGFDRLTEIVGQLLSRNLDVHLLVVGEGDFESLACVPEDRYTQIGWQAHEMMPRYVAAFDVLPLTYQADMPCYFSPLKLMEAMGCGVVPVVPDMGDLPDIVTHQVTGLVYKAGDSAQLLQQLESLILDKHLQDTLGQRAATEAARHSWTNIAEHVLETAACCHREISSGALQSAFSKLRSIHIDEQQVRRVAVEKQGAIHLEVRQAGRQRYFVYQAAELSELQAGSDSKIPFALRWRESNFAKNHAIISYRPGRRMVLGSEMEDQTHVIKAYRKRKTAQAAENYRRVLSACASGGFKIPRLLKVDKDNDYLLIEKLPGHEPVVATGAIDNWSAIGACLRQFQRSDTGDGLPEFSHTDELAVLDERARRFLLCKPSLPSRWLEGRQQLQEAAEKLPLAGLGLAHRDLHDRQFIVCGESIGLLDFDLICKADVALDAANLLAHINLRVLQACDKSEVSAIDACSQALLNGLGRQDEPGFVQRLLFFQASTYYRLALLYALRPRWAHLTDHLIDEGETCINTFNRTGADS